MRQRVEERHGRSGDDVGCECRLRDAVDEIHQENTSEDFKLSVPWCAPWCPRRTVLGFDSLVAIFGRAERDEGGNTTLCVVRDIFSPGE